jgi:uncharacterized lipoprotein YddW (UPF0748 family)
MWTWVHGTDAVPADEWRRRFARIRAAGINAVLVSGGSIERISSAARTEGVEFHRWTWTLNRNGDAWVKANHPEWFSVSRSGDSSLEKPPYVNYYQWLCPTRPEVREYLRDQVRVLASTAGVAGVHLDYVRHPDVILPVGLWEKYGLVQDREHPQFDFCYCRVCRDSFRQLTGTDPLQLPDPTTDQDWREFRWNAVTDTVRMLAEAVRGAGAPISAAVFPTPTLARKLVRQAWEQWPLDAVFPMLYHRFYLEELAWIGRSASEGVASLEGRAPLYAGLYLPDLSPEELAEAVGLVRGAGASGVALFEMNGLSDAHLDALRGAVRP